MEIMQGLVEITPIVLEHQAMGLKGTRSVVEPLQSLKPESVGMSMMVFLLVSPMPCHYILVRYVTPEDIQGASNGQVDPVLTEGFDFIEV
jgi:hypothetical protein